jgi:hypothetical protein
MARQATGDGGAFVQFATNDDGSVEIRATIDLVHERGFILRLVPGHEVILVSASRCSEGNVDRQARAGYL